MNINDRTWYSDQQVWGKSCLKAKGKGGDRKITTHKHHYEFTQSDVELSGRSKPQNYFHK